jgi:hypothetical protein
MILSSAQLFQRYPSTSVRAAAIAFSFRWDTMTGNGNLIWGTYKVPNWEPFYTIVDVIGESFKCTCPSRENPCKHIIALWMLLLEKPESFETQMDPPDWVQKWLDRNAPKSSKERTAGELIASDTRKEQSRSERLEIMMAGARDLENWLSDLMRSGLSGIAAGDFNTAAIAARMVDSKLGGLAKKLRQLAGETPGMIEDRESVLLSRTSDLYIAARAIAHLDDLPGLLQQDILTFCGVNTRKDDLLALPSVADEWIVLGQCEGEEEPSLRYRRVWLQGKSTGQLALILDYAFGGADFPYRWQTGKSFRCALTYYPSAFPLRAITRAEPESVDFVRKWEGLDRLSGFAESYATALGMNPLIQVFPACLKQMVPALRQGQLYAIDQYGAAIPLVRQGIKDWKLLGISAGEPVDIFGEWDGNMLYPLSVWSDGRARFL